MVVENSHNFVVDISHNFAVEVLHNFGITTYQRSKRNDIDYENKLVSNC
jgi:hypothetical protein